MLATRREVLRGALAASACAVAGGAPLAHAAAAIPYGAALYVPDMDADPRLEREVARLCQRTTPVNEMKWKYLRPSADSFDFAACDRIANFARREGLAMHGHTLVWYAENPDWLSSLGNAAEAELALTRHIQTVMNRYHDVARSWDVINEPIPDVAHTPAARRDTVWRALMGEGYLEKALRIAHEVDPQALLVVNEYDVEFANEHSPAKRAAFADLIRRLVDSGAPLHAVGLQGHLRGGWPIAKDELAAFVKEMRGLGLKILVTELDVMDHELPGPAAERDRAVAAQVTDFLEAITASGPLDSLTTWGLTDKFTWIKWAYKRADGLGNRPLPLDEDYRRKPMFDVVERFRMVA